MKDITAYIESGILELYAMGMTTPAETAEVEEMALEHDAVRDELAAICDSLENLAHQNAIAPHATVKPMLLASLNYIQRLQSGEQPANPPRLNHHSTIKDYSQWLDRADFQDPDLSEGIFVRLIGHVPGLSTAIVWISEMAPDEVHNNEHESFLIVEGTCDIFVGDDTYHMKPGDYLAIPLYKSHHVKVTSKTPCKVILQRAAA